MMVAQGEPVVVGDERELAGLAASLGAASVPGMSPREGRLLARGRRPARGTVDAARSMILAGRDPLGAAFTALRSPAERRPAGATYTPPVIVDAMVAWARRQGEVARVVDPGAGSGRFAVAAGRAFPGARIIAVETDPLAALTARAHLAAAGLAARAEVLVVDYRALRLPRVDGRTLFLGNPPYVRHHQIASGWKRWLAARARRRGLPASRLAGLHVHFFLATAEHAAPGDFGALVTAAEWLDVGYGELARRLFLDGLGGAALHVIEPAAHAFPDAAATAVITCFHAGGASCAVDVRRVASVDGLGDLPDGVPIAAAELAAASRWTPLTRFASNGDAAVLPDGDPRSPGRPGGWRAERGQLIELGELCRVHRGQATGDNGFWILPSGGGPPGVPRTLLFPCVTRARELFDAGLVLAGDAPLRRVLDLPEDLGSLPRRARAAVDRLLRRARAAGIHHGYLASHRHPWWRVALHEPAPILATYMARRPPAFVRNLAGARHLNIAHGIYPRVPLSGEQLDALAVVLAATTTTAQGRTYAGGLTKFEPKEMERLLVPPPEALVEAARELQAARAEAVVSAR